MSQSEGDTKWSRDGLYACAVWKLTHYVRVQPAGYNQAAMLERHVKTVDLVCIVWYRVKLRAYRSGSLLISPPYAVTITLYSV